MTEEQAERLAVALDRLDNVAKRLDDGSVRFNALDGRVSQHDTDIAVIRQKCEDSLKAGGCQLPGADSFSGWRKWGFGSAFGLFGMLLLLLILIMLERLGIKFPVA